MKAFFGLVQQGHIPTIQKMRAESKTWEEIAQSIGWGKDSVSEHYTKYLESRIVEMECGLKPLIQYFQELIEDVKSPGTKQTYQAMIDIGERALKRNTKVVLNGSHPIAKLTVDLPEEGLKTGNEGKVVFEYKGGEAYEVEFLFGGKIKTLTLSKNQVVTTRS